MWIMNNTIYKNQQSRQILMQLYDDKLKSLDIEYEEFDVDTFAGKTRVIVTGKTTGKPIVMFHGINAGSPITLEAIKGLRSDYRLYLVDTIGQTTKSAETRLPLNDDSLARWIVDVLDFFKLEKVNTIGISYGAFLVQKIIKYAPSRLDKVVFVVPSGFVNGSLYPSLKKLTIPLMRFMFSKSEKHLRDFMSAFYHSVDDDWVEFQKNTLLGVKMDYRRPPLFKETDALNFNNPVFAIFAEDDVFFPSHLALKRCEKIFNNFEGYHILKGAKHIPHKEIYPEIEAKITDWLK
jgi:pimeloyl-ACP methyl ester carboxylesterase